MVELFPEHTLHLRTCKIEEHPVKNTPTHVVLQNGWFLDVSIVWGGGRGFLVPRTVVTAGTKSLFKPLYGSILFVSNMLVYVNIIPLNILNMGSIDLHIS